MKEDENFIKFKKDIEGKKQTVLFIGASVNYANDRKMMWPDLLNYLMEDFVLGDAIWRRDKSRLYKVDGMGKQ